MSRKRNRRFPISPPILKEVRLSLFAHAYGNSKTGMAEQIITDKVSGSLEWYEIQSELRQEAAIRRIPVEQLVVEVLEADGYGDEMDIHGVDWSTLFEPMPIEPEGENG